jgi:hypothetical protein
MELLYDRAGDVAKGVAVRDERPGLEPPAARWCRVVARRERERDGNVDARVAKKQQLVDSCLKITDAIVWLFIAQALLTNHDLTC